jgi:hypothetical protein
MTSETFTATPKLTDLGTTATKEFKLARDINDSIKPKQREFDDLKRDAKAKMEARREQHVERAKKALEDARELMRIDRLGSFDAWLKSGAVIGMNGKPIGKAQVYNLIEGKSKSSPNTPKVRKTSTQSDGGGRSTRGTGGSTKVEPAPEPTCEAAPFVEAPGLPHLEPVLTMLRAVTDKADRQFIKIWLQLNWPTPEPTPPEPTLRRAEPEPTPQPADADWTAAEPEPQPVAAAVPPSDPPMVDWPAPTKTREQTAAAFEKAGEFGLGDWQREQMRIDASVVEALVADGLLAAGRDGRIARVAA